MRGQNDVWGGCVYGGDQVVRQSNMAGGAGVWTSDGLNWGVQKKGRDHGELIKHTKRDGHNGTRMPTCPWRQMWYQM